jgi:hypothetical protein
VASHEEIREAVRLLKANGLALEGIESRLPRAEDFRRIEAKFVMFPMNDDKRHPILESLERYAVFERAWVDA